MEMHTTFPNPKNRLPKNLTAKKKLLRMPVWMRLSRSIALLLALLLPMIETNSPSPAPQTPTTPRVRTESSCGLVHTKAAYTRTEGLPTRLPGINTSETFMREKGSLGKVILRTIGNAKGTSRSERFNPDLCRHRSHYYQYPHQVLSTISFDQCYSAWLCINT
jgi:hypothetical protein